MIEIELGGRVPRELEVRAERVPTIDVDLGVSEFDAAVELRGPPAYISAAFDHPTRRLGGSSATRCASGTS